MRLKISKIDKISINNENLDRRIKLKKDDKKHIIELYNSGLKIREIARHYPQVSRRSIQFVIFPERLAKVNYSGHWKVYYNREKQAIAIKKYRDYKRQLCKDNLI